MRYLVTGAAGFIGSHLCKALVAQGHQVWGLDDLSTGKLENLEQLQHNSQFNLAIGCISNQKLLYQIISQVDVIYHLAAVVGVKRYVEDPVRVIDVNVCYTSGLLQLAWQLGKKVIFSSTSETYGKSHHVPFEEGADRVYGSSQTARWCYAISKSADEHLCLGYAKKGLPVVIIRYFNVYGPGADSSAYGGVATRFINQALTGSPLTVHGDGLQTRCFTYIDDIVKGTIRAGNTLAAEGKIFNMGHYRETAILELAQLVIKLVGQGGAITFQPYTQFYGASYEDIPRRIPDLSAAEQILGYQPHVTLEEGLAKTISWYGDKL